MAIAWLYRLGGSFYGKETNLPPVANAGPNQTNVLGGEIVTLNGTASSDDSAIASYSWIAPDNIQLSDNTSATPTFTAPSSDSIQTLVFVLTVVDDQGISSNASAVVITVLADSEEVLVFTEALNSKDVFHEKIDQVFAAAFEVKRDSNNFITYKSLDSYGDAEYYIYNSQGVRLVTLSLGNGIDKVGTDFIISVPNNKLAFTGTFKHTLVAISGTKRDLVFKRDLVIESGY